MARAQRDPRSARRAADSLPSRECFANLLVRLRLSALCELRVERLRSPSVLALRALPAASAGGARAPLNIDLIAAFYNDSKHNCIVLQIFSRPIYCYSANQQSKNYSS